MTIIAHAASKSAMVMSGDLKKRFFGEARAKGNSAQTSYNNKRAKALELGIIAPVEGVSVGTYTLTEFGQKVIDHAEAKGVVVADLKSKAQLAWEAAH